MKKLLSFLIIFIIFFVCTIKSMALTGNGFIWNTTEIYVEVNTSFESYISRFHVVFYYNGKITNEEVKVGLDNFYYGSNTISTNEICDKDVVLYAYVPGYTNYEKKTIKVHIYDNIKPTINCIRSLNLNIGDEFNPEDYFTITDNDKIDPKTVKYEYDERELKIVGEHKISVYASDMSSNFSSRTFTYYISDSKSPILNVASNIEINYGDKDFDIRNFADAYDDYDGNVSNSITCEGLDIYKLGEQDITIKVSDGFGNVTKIKKKLYIVDFEAPKLELKTYEDNINIEDIDNIDFKSYISKISDNVDDLNINDVYIDTSSMYYSVGQSEIIYTLFDSTGNYTKRTLLLNVRFSEGPLIEANNLEFEVGESFNLKDYISVSSPYDENVSNNYCIDDSAVNKLKPGTYEVIIEALDYAGNESKKSIYVTIKNDSTSSMKEKTFNIYELIYKNKYIVVVLIIALFGYIFYLKSKHNKKLGL